MEGKTKLKLLLLTVLGTLVTTYFVVIPSLFNVWTDDATLNHAFVTGLIIGTAFTLYWVYILTSWSEA